MNTLNYRKTPDSAVGLVTCYQIANDQVITKVWDRLCRRTFPDRTRALMWQRGDSP
jgi:hypothetical protein